MNEENEREQRVAEVTIVKQEKIRKAEERWTFFFFLRRLREERQLVLMTYPWSYCLGKVAVEFLMRTLNKILESERIHEERRISALLLIFKN